MTSYGAVPLAGLTPDGWANTMLVVSLPPGEVHPATAAGGPDRGAAPATARLARALD